MSRMDEIKARAIEDNPERKMTYDAEATRLKTAVMVVELREQHSLSQQMLAEKAGVPKSTIVGIENAHVSTTLEMLKRITGCVDKELKINFV